MRRIPELDALRALAAAVVLLFHIHPPTFFFGWTGVDLFFVLSGYLITKIIVDHEDAEHFYYHFYVRRGLRIWPIYYLTLFGLIVLNCFLSRPEPMDALVYFLTYTQRIQYYWHKDPPPFHIAFQHTWTLALEEQFYLLWPAMVRLAGRKRLVGLCVVVVVVGYLARTDVITVAPYPEWILISRCDGFALGGLLAALLADRERVKRYLMRYRLGFGLAGLAGLGFLVGAVAIYGRGFMGLPTPAYPAPTILAVDLAYFGVVGLILTLTGHWVLAPLRFRPLVYLGQISYGIYLYHYIIYWMLDGFAFHYDRPWLPGAPVKLGATVAVAMVSWHLIEQPILGLKKWFPYEPDARGQVTGSRTGDA
jgi:peptidoglycan/LPS O-acetylase OafA/YrhL